MASGDLDALFESIGILTREAKWLQEAPFSERDNISNAGARAFESMGSLTWLIPRGFDVREEQLGEILAEFNNLSRSSEDASRYLPRYNEKVINLRDKKLAPLKQRMDQCSPSWFASEFARLDQEIEKLSRIANSEHGIGVPPYNMAGLAAHHLQQTQDQRAGLETLQQGLPSVQSQIPKIEDEIGRASAVIGGQSNLALNARDSIPRLMEDISRTASSMPKDELLVLIFDMCLLGAMDARAARVIDDLVRKMLEGFDGRTVAPVVQAKADAVTALAQDTLRKTERSD